MSLMLAEKKLREAEYWLGTLKKLDPNYEEFRYHLGAFLSAMRSVMDYLLEDYSRKFSLGISLDEKLYPKTFREKAEQMKHKDALDFIEWWKQKKEELENDKIIGPLITTRHVYIHRQPVPLSAKVEISDTIGLSDSIEITVYDNEGNIKSHYKSKEDLKQKSSGGVKVEWFFRDYNEEPIIPVCEKYLEVMRKIVDEAKQKFG